MLFVLTSIQYADRSQRDPRILKSVFRLFNDNSTELRSKIVGIYFFLIAFNVGAWIWAFIGFHGQLVLLGTALLAYTSGLPRCRPSPRVSSLPAS